MNIKDFEQLAVILKDNYDITRYLLRNHITEEDIKKLNKNELIEKMYKKEVEIQREETENYINQIRLLYEVYKRLKRIASKEMRIIPFYSFIKSIDEYGGLVEDIIECSAPKYIEDLHVHCNNENRWIEFICQDDFNLEDLESGKIKFSNNNRLRLFEHIGKGIFKLILDVETELEEESHDYNYNNKEIITELNKVFDNDKILMSKDTDGILMINNQAFKRVSNFRDLSLDCIESGVMCPFIDWYRKEYNDCNFYGSNDYEDTWREIDNREAYEQEKIKNQWKYKRGL